MWIFWAGNHRSNIFLSYIEPDMIYFSSIFPAGLNKEQRSGNRSGLKEGKATLRGQWCCRGWDEQVPKGKKTDQKSISLSVGGEQGGEMNSLHR